MPFRFKRPHVHQTGWMNLCKTPVNMPVDFSGNKQDHDLPSTGHAHLRTYTPLAYCISKKRLFENDSLKSPTCTKKSERLKGADVAQFGLGRGISPDYASEARNQSDRELSILSWSCISFRSIRRNARLCRMFVRECRSAATTADRTFEGRYWSKSRSLSLDLPQTPFTT